MRTGSASTPNQQAKLTASDAAADDEFGWSVALYGSTAVVGAPFKPPIRGKAYVFVRSGTHWSQQAKLTEPHAAAGDEFGYSVAVYGSTAVVGAPGRNSNSGAAYVFVRSGTAWSRQAKLIDPHAAKDDDFGGSAALSGSTVVVGAFGNKGAAYVFVRSGTAWKQRARLTAPHAAKGDDFGGSVALSGSTAVVGARYRNSGRGAAYVFVRSGTAWKQQAKLIAHHGALVADFGQSVALYRSTAIVGAPGTNGRGAAYVFVRSGTHWSQQAKLTASHGAPSDDFGQSVALYGSTAVAGAPAAAQTGAAYVFVRSGTAWKHRAKLIASDAAAFDKVGWSVALYGSTALVGAPFKNSYTGAAYVFGGV